MPLTLLLDLDDTLLETNLEAFLPAYYDSFASCLADVVPPRQFLTALESGVRLMMLSQDPARTLQQVFETEFYARLGADPGVLGPRIREYYGGTYRTLHTRTRRRRGATELIQSARSAGHVLALATDPLFPEVATLERIRWAGLDPKDFEVISTFETFHFSKSHPEYYAELLGRLGWPDQPVLMAGNDVQRDLAPASELGLATFHVVSEGDGTGRPAGDLFGLKDWIEHRAGELPPPGLSSRQAILSVLDSTPAALDGMTMNLPDHAWRSEPGPEEWALIELVCHLRDTEREVHSQQLRTLIDSPDPFVARPDAAYWAKQRRYLDEDGPSAIAEFARIRKNNLEILRQLPERTWAKAARHAIFGPSGFQEVIGFMAEHDRLHLQQAWRTLRAVGALAHPK